MYLLVMVDGTLDSLLVLIANDQASKGGLVLEHLQVAIGVRHVGPLISVSRPETSTYSSPPG